MVIISRNSLQEDLGTVNCWKGAIYTVKNNLFIDTLTLDDFEGGNGDHWISQCKSNVGLFIVLF